MYHPVRGWLAAGLLVCSTSLHAIPIAIDGDLSDWGVSVGDGSGAQIVGSDYTGLGSGLAAYHLEDTNDLSNSYFLGPNYGGQNYDAEFLGVAVDKMTLYIAILTGQRPDNGFRFYSPGDVYITTDAGIFGIEIGGGPGGGAGHAISEGSSGSTYILNSHGYTTGYTPAAAAQVAGSVWFGADWINDPIGPHYQPVQLAINAASTQVGLADLVFTRNSLGTQHAVIELGLDLGAFGGATIEAIQWAPSCDNDELLVRTQLHTVPEPAPLALLVVGLAGLGLTRRRTAGDAAAG